MISPVSNDDVPSALGRFRAAFAASRSYEVDFRVASDASSLSNDVRGQFLLVPGVSEYSDDVSGRTLIVVTKGRLLSDGLSHIRVERLNLISGGNAARNTQVQAWNASQLAESPSADGTGKATFRAIQDQSWDQLVELRRRGIMSYDHQRAMTGYLPLAQFLIRALESARDAEADSTPGGGIRIRSELAGLAATIDAGSGELLSADIVDTSGTVTAVSFSGWLDGKFFPSRHPRERRVIEHRGASPLSHGDVTIYDAVRLVRAHDAASFEWRSFARSGIDAVSKTEADQQGNRTPLVTSSESIDSVPRVLSDKTLAPAPSTWSRSSTIGLFIAGTVGAGVIALRLRRRFGS